MKGKTKKMKHLKEYKKRLEDAMEFGWLDTLTTEEISELRRDLKQAAGVILNGSNNKAMIQDVNGVKVLRSYYTDVCKIENGKFIKTWDGFSTTTMKHINQFRSLYKMPALSKYDWIMLPTE